MKKITIAMLCFFLSTGLTHARFFSMGPRIGASILQVKVNPAQGNTALADLQPKDHWDYHVGVFARLDLLIFYVQPEILLTSSDFKFSKHNKVRKLGFTKLDVPVMVGFYLFRVARAQIGPVVSLCLNAKEGEKDVRKRYSSSSTIGWQVGLGFDVCNVVIDLKYEGNLSRFRNKIAGVHTNHKYAVWVLSAGFNIL